MMSREEKLEYQTERYWNSNPTAKKYIQGLLPEELKYLIDHGKLTEKLSETEILVQLVGYSWEPILISICAHKPDVVVPILNKKYIEKGDGEIWGNIYKENIHKLKKQGLINDISGIPEIFPPQWETVGDQPKDVFRFLKTHVLSFVNEGKKVVVDITGAKKSMASGAYLFSSYTNAPVVYLNYDKYSGRYGRPYGYTCKLDKLEDPLKIFKLHEWGRVRQLYENYAFRSANILVKEIQDGAKSFFDSEDVDSIDVLIEWIEFYRLWDEGNYKACLAKWDDVLGGTGGKTPDAHCPTAVVRLGEIWPNKDDFRGLKSGFKRIEGLPDITESIYLKDKEILTYAYDELGKIKRLIIPNEDYRSALLRAAGLNEVLLEARIVRSWVGNQFSAVRRGINFEDRNDMRTVDFDLLNTVDGNILRTSTNAVGLIKFLRGIESPLDVRGVRLIQSVSARRLNEFWLGIESNGMVLPKDVFDIRHKAIHFCLSIPKEIAEVAAKMAEENLKDFQNYWVDDALTNGTYEAMNWNELCDVCGINFLPKRSEEG